MKYCPDCGGELGEEGICTECDFDTTEDLEEDGDDDSNEWEES